jgi:RNA recognition motif-containing protein
MANDKRTIYVGGLAEEVTDKLLSDAFIPFGDLIDIQMPIDYETQKHRGFAFVEFETAEDAAAAIDNMVRTLNNLLHFSIKNSNLLPYRTMPNCLEKLYESTRQNHKE